MKRHLLFMIVILLAAAGVFAVKYAVQGPEGLSLRGCCPSVVPPLVAPTEPAPESGAAPPVASDLPVLLDFGAGSCQMCQAMMPILDELEAEYAGRLEVEYIDVRHNPAGAQAFSIRTIPTQVFMAPDGTELYRHTGFISKDDIVAQWRELGYTFE